MIIVKIGGGESVVKHLDSILSDFASIKEPKILVHGANHEASKISEKLGIEKGDVQATVETFMEEVKTSLESGDNVYLRGFGSFIIKTRAEKTGRNISKNTTIKIPAHNIPAFKPAKVFVEGVKTNVDVK